MADVLGGFLRGFGAVGSDIMKEKRLQENELDTYTKKYQTQKTIDLWAAQEAATAEAKEQARQAEAALKLRNGSAGSGSNMVPQAQLMFNQDGNTSPSLSSEETAFDSPTGVSGEEPTISASGTMANDDVTDQEFMAEFLALPKETRRDVTTATVLAERKARERKTKESLAQERVDISRESLALRQETSDMAKEEKIRKNDPVLKAESEAVQAEISEALKAEKTLQKDLLDFDKFEAANNSKFSWGSALPNVSKGAGVLVEAKVTGALKRVQETVGAISNAEMDLFGKSSISPDNRWAVNQGYINAGRAVLIRNAQKADFIKAWLAEGKPAQEGLDAFRAFAEATPIMGQENGIIVLNTDLETLRNDKSYMEYLNYSPEAVAPQDTSGDVAPAAPSQIPSTNLRQKYGY